MLYLEKVKNKGKRLGKGVLQIPLWIGRGIDHSVREQHEWLNYVQYLIIMAAIGYEASRIHARLDEIDSKLD
jgi:hypothetical protein